MSAPYQGLGPTLAECLTAEKNALTKELAQVKAERDDWKIRADERRIETDEARAKCLDLAGSLNADKLVAEAERDTALRERDEAVENVAALLRDVDQLPWIPDSFRIGWRFLARLGWSSLDEPPAPAVSGTPDTKEDA